jgi:Zn-dependent M16 (insulinase) family peptidase
LRENAAPDAPVSASPPRNSAYTSSEYTSTEVFSSASLQVGFAALSLPASPFTRKEHAVELVLSHHLSTGAFWEEIRMKGGAYGAFAHPDGLERCFHCSSYRDPDPLRSAGAFAAVLRKQAKTPVDGETLEKAIIGSYAKETRPHTPAEKGGADFLRFLYEIDDRHRERKLRALLDVSTTELTEAAERLAAAGAVLSIIAPPAAAKEAAARLGVDAWELPV